MTFKVLFPEYLFMSNARQKREKEENEKMMRGAALMAISDGMRPEDIKAVHGHLSFDGRNQDFQIGIEYKTPGSPPEAS